MYWPISTMPIQYFSSFLMLKLKIEGSKLKIISTEGKEQVEVQNSKEKGFLVSCFWSFCPMSKVLKITVVKFNVSDKNTRFA